MKKLFILFAILAIAGIASAANIPGAVDPKTGPETWVTQVYNNDTTTLSVGDVVVWDMQNSTGDDDNYVVDTTTAHTGIVAGVVHRANIASGSEGLIAIQGSAVCDVVDGGVAANSLLCSSGVAGEAKSCYSEANNKYAFGMATAAGAGTTVQCIIF